MAIKQYKSNKRYKCPYCEERYFRGDLIEHVEKEHEALIPEGYDATRVVYDSINKTDHGKCMICGKPVYEWDSKHYKYKNLCDNPKCREEVRRIALERHMRVYNKPTLLDDPEQQEKMLARRRISGSYKFTDGGLVNYTGKYERNALEFIDKVMGYKSSDIECPGPVLTYEFQGKEHNYIPDIYIIPANLLIEVKDGGNNPNNRNMPEYRAKQLAKEEMVTKLGTMNYLRLTNNQFDQLLAILADIKLENLDNSDDPAKKFHINESSSVLSESISISKIKLNKKSISKYKSQAKYLGHFRDNSNVEGYIYLDNDNVVGAVAVEAKEDGKWIQAIEVSKEYKGLGYGKALLNDALNVFKAEYLSVNKNNEIAIKMYLKAGFKAYKETENQYFMTINKNINESSSILNENSIKEFRDNVNSAKDLYSWMKRNIKYKHTGKFMSSEEVLNKGYGDCHDQSNFEYDVLSELGYTCGRLFMVEYYDYNSPGGSTHTICYFYDNNKIYWFENAWADKAGIHGPYNSIDALKKDIFKNWYFSGKNNKLYISAIGNVKPGMSLSEYVEACTPENEPKKNVFMKDSSIDESGFINEKDIYANFSDVEKVCSSLSALDLERISRDGKYENSENVIYRYIEKIGNIPVGFIDVYWYEKVPTNAYIILAVNPKYRGRGIASKMVQNAIHSGIDKQYKFKEYIWHADKDNIESQKLAEKHGFTTNGHLDIDKRWYEYKLYVNSINEAACPSCGGGVPASCATIPRGINISTDSIQLNGEIGPFVFSYPEDDECTYFDGNGNHEVKTKNECGSFNFLVEVFVKDPSKLNTVYEYLTTNESVNIKDICYIATDKMPLSLMEMVVGYREIVFHRMVKANIESYVNNGISVMNYTLDESVMKELVYPHVSIAFCKEGYYAFTDKYPFATTVRKNRNSIRMSEIKALSDLYNKYENISKV